MDTHRSLVTKKDTAARRRFLALYLLLLAALALNMASTLLPHGAITIALRLGVAGLMGTLIAIIFMRLNNSNALVRLISGASLLWISFLFILSFADYLTR